MKIMSSYGIEIKNMNKIFYPTIAVYNKEGYVAGNVKQLGENICDYCSTKDLSYLAKPAVTEKPIGQTYKVKQQEQLKVG